MTAGLTEADIRRMSLYPYLRDFKCLATDDPDWPHDLDRHLSEDEFRILVKACHIIHDGGCHTDTDSDCLEILDGVVCFS